MLCVVPVNPCSTSAPTGPPSARKGSAPARTATRAHLRRCPLHARTGEDAAHRLPGRSTGARPTPWCLAGGAPRVAYGRPPEALLGFEEQAGRAESIYPG